MLMNLNENYGNLGDEDDERIIFEAENGNKDKKHFK
jgi:hypothetical protein